MEYLDKEEKDTEIDESKEKPSTEGRDRVWVGTTEFRVIPIDEELKTLRMSWEDGPKKVMNRGQRKKIHAEVQDIEKEDYALWSVLGRQRPAMPRGWKALLELFAGAAVLTATFQAQGCECCQPLDIRSGWNVFDNEQRKQVEHTIERAKTPPGQFSADWGLLKDLTLWCSTWHLWWPSLGATILPGLTGLLMQRR